MTIKMVIKIIVLSRGKKEIRFPLLNSLILPYPQLTYILTVKLDIRFIEFKKLGT